MDASEDRFAHAKEAYFELINIDFPEFDPTNYAQEKASETNRPDSSTAATPDNKPNFKNKLFSAFDLSGDGKLSIADLSSVPETIAKNAASTADKTAKATKAVLASFDVTKIASEAKSAAANASQTVANIEVSEIADTAIKIGKTAIGAQGFQDRNTAKNIEGICCEYYEAAESITEQKRQKLNYAITDFGEYRLNSLHQTVGRFLQYLKELKQNNAVKEYEILFHADIDTKTLGEMEHIDMVASEALRTTAITGAYGAAAVLGTPALVTGAVGTLATASTGTAISSLSGAAATNATLAWLGGGSIAAGGGGVAAGSVALAAVTVGATAVTAILTAGTLVSLHYGKKLTEAEEYEKDVGMTVGNLEKAWIVMEGISKRTSELREVTEELKWKTSGLLDQLGNLIPDFDFTDSKCVTVFNKCAHLIKTMVELAQTPLLDDEGNLSSESIEVSGKVRRILNTEV